MDTITQLKNLQNLFAEFVDTTEYIQTLCESKNSNAVKYNSKTDNTLLNGMYDSNNDKNGVDHLNDVDLARNSCGTYSMANNSINSHSNGEIVNPKASSDLCNFTNRPGDVNGTVGGCQSHLVSNKPINTLVNEMYGSKNYDHPLNKVNMTRNDCDTYSEANKSINSHLNREIVSRKVDPKVSSDLCNNRPGDMNGTEGVCQSHSVLYKPNNTLLNGMYDSTNDKNGVDHMNNVDLTWNSCGTYSMTNNSINSSSNGEIVNPKASSDLCNFTNRPGDVNGTVGGCQSHLVSNKPINTLVEMTRNDCDTYSEANKSINSHLNREIVSRKVDPKVSSDLCNNRPGDMNGTEGVCQSHSVLYKPNNTLLNGMYDSTNDKNGVDHMNNVDLTWNSCGTYSMTNNSINSSSNGEIVNPKASSDLCNFTNRPGDVNGTVGGCQSHLVSNKPINTLVNEMYGSKNYDHPLNKVNMTRNDCDTYSEANKSINSHLNREIVSRKVDPKVSSDLCNNRPGDMNGTEGVCQSHSVLYKPNNTLLNGMYDSTNDKNGVDHMNNVDLTWNSCGTYSMTNNSINSSSNGEIVNPKASSDLCNFTNRPGDVNGTVGGCQSHLVSNKPINTLVNEMYGSKNYDHPLNKVNMTRNDCDTYSEANKSINSHLNREIVSRKVDPKVSSDLCNNRPGDMNGTEGVCQSHSVLYKPNNTLLNGMYDSTNDKNGVDHMNNVDLTWNSCGTYSMTNNSINSSSNGEIVNPKASSDLCNFTNRPGDVNGTVGGCQSHLVSNKPINTLVNEMYGSKNYDHPLNKVNMTRNDCDTYSEANKSINSHLNREIVSRKVDPKALHDLCNNRPSDMNGIGGGCESYSTPKKPNNNLWNVELFSSSEKSMVIDISQPIETTNVVMGTNLRKETTFNENCLDQILTKTFMNEKESYTNLTNYFYYLTENSESHDLLDDILEMPTGNEIHNSEMTEEMLSQNHSGTGGEYVTLNDNMMVYNLGSLNGNEVVSSELTKEMVEQNYTEIEGESKYVTLTDVGTLGCNLGSCVGNQINSSEMRKGMAEQNKLGTGGDLSEYVTFSVDTADQSGEGFEADAEQTSSNADVEPCRLNFMNVKPRQGCDNTKMYVPTSDEGRCKKLCCYYCLERYPKLARHLAGVHKNKKEVKKFVALPIESICEKFEQTKSKGEYLSNLSNAFDSLVFGSKKRRAIIDKIRKWGQFEWNTNSKINGGELSTSRRPSKKYRIRAIHYKTCAKCRGTYTVNVLRYHWKICTKNCFPGERIIKELSRAVEGRLHENAFDDLRTIIFPKMREDEAVLDIRYDWIVITFGNDLCLNYSPHYQHAMIRNHLRNTGKLLLASRKISPNIKDFDSLYYVKNCNTVIEAIRMIAKFDAKSKTFESPATAAALVTLINNIGELLIIECMKEDDEDKEKSVERFLKVFKKEAKLKISKIVTMCQLKARREKIENITTTDDVGKLATYLDHERETCFMELTERYSFENWLYLAQLTMMSILIFNRKRVGDTQNMLVDDFRRREIITERSDVIPRNTREMIKSRMKIRGKLYRTVPVLLKHNFDECLDILLRYRKDVGVPDNNEFLFGIPSKSLKIKVIDAGALFRKFSELCGAQNPSSLRGTNLRKHFASMCATIELSDNELTTVAKFMGHSEKVHKDVYRHNPLENEVVQMSPLLQVAQGNNNVGLVTQGKKNIDIGGQVAISNDNPETKRKRTKKQANVVPTKKTRKQINVVPSNENSKTKQKQTKKEANVIPTKKPQKQINDGQVAPSNENSETKRKRTKKQANVVSIKKSPKQIKGN